MAENMRRKAKEEAMRAGDQNFWRIVLLDIGITCIQRAVDGLRGEANQFAGHALEELESARGFLISDEDKDE